MSKDIWDIADIVAKIVAAVFLPIALLFVGHWYDVRQRMSTEQQLIADTTAKRITDLLKSLSSDSARERVLALTVAQYFGTKGELPQELLAPIRELALRDPNADVARAAGGVLFAAKQATPALSEALIKSVAEAPARVYIHIGTDLQRDLAKRIAATLTASGYSVPGIERVDVLPTRTQVRFFRPDDKPRAEDLAKLLDEANIRNVQVQLIAGYENRAPVKQLEIWFAGTS